MSDEAIGRLSRIYIDVSDLRRSAAFWGRVLGLRPGEPRGQFLDVGAHEGTTCLVLQQVPERKTVKNRVHLDIDVPDLGNAVKRVEALGGHKVREVCGPFGRFAVMADPDGNEFCFIPPRA